MWFIFDFECVCSPQEVTELQRVYAKHRMKLPGFVASVHAGRANSATITDDGRVIVWGAGSCACVRACMRA